MLREERRHELGVLDAHAEAERAHRVNVAHVPLGGAEHRTGPHVVGGVELLERVHVVAAGAEVDGREVDVVVDAEVLKRHDQRLVDGVPEADLRGDAVIETPEYRLAVGALGVAVSPSRYFGVR